MPRGRLPGMPKVGGRRKGSTNRATREWRTYLRGVFADALLDDPDARRQLIQHIQAWSLDPRLLQLLLAYAYGAPPREVDVQHTGHVTLAQLVSGSALARYVDEDDDEDDDDGANDDDGGPLPS